MKTKNSFAVRGNARTCCRCLVFASALVLALALGTAQAHARSGGGYNAGGGYSGPAPAPVTTVEQAKGMHDDTRVTLTGNITRSLGGKHYEFKDATGVINVEISDKKWQGQTVGPDDLVEIDGEIDKERTTVEIDVKRIRKR